MGSRKIIMLVGSILIGALAGFALLNYVNGVEEDVKQEAARVPVWVVSEDIGAGTTAVDAQRTGRLQLREIESEFRPETAISDLKQIEGRIAVANLAANQILVQGMFESPQVVATTFTDLLDPDHVAVSVTFPKNKAVAGFLNPGDFVDIVALSAAPTPGEGEEDVFDTSARSTSPYQRPARFLYRGVRIIAINNEVIGGATFGDEVVADEPVAAGSLTLTFSVPAEAAQKLLSVNEADLVLTLLPNGWVPEALPNLIPDLILADAPLPGEQASEVTPYGREGLQSVIADLVEDAADETAAAEKSAPAEETAPADDGQPVEG